ncbi:hypothetical protein PV08_08044 [Exophiala spinifera]|uniref:Uncharacterized protein n=1 Tax=Exophiala spinifera TaxID=91928 RepID=A0A0D1ZJ24_9EURO|nr:uncharacterized protein PV08_08044 [Exophiala spinifera]KIW12857.1 hypothetical protein PV08_08044 [Exophiala spinifera]
MTESIAVLASSSQPLPESVEDVASGPKVAFPPGPLEESLGHGRRGSSGSATSATSGPSSRSSQDDTTPPTSASGSEEELDDECEVDVDEIEAPGPHDTTGVAPERCDEETFGEMMVWEVDDLIHGFPIPASHDMAPSPNPTTPPTLVRKVVASLVLQGCRSLPTVATVAGIQALQSGAVLCGSLQTTLLNPLANVLAHLAASRASLHA